MIIVKPAEIGAGQVISTTAADEYPSWTSGSHTKGSRVVHNMFAWEALATVTSEPSDAVPLDWLKLGYSNKWRMFFNGIDSRTTATELLEVDLAIGVAYGTLAVLGLIGQSVTLTVTDPVAGVVYTKTEQLIDIGVMDFWSWYFQPYDQNDTVVFDGIPPYPSALTEISVNGGPSEVVGAGRVIAGTEIEIGATLSGTSIEFMDYSTRERDAFGNLTIVKRRVVTMVDYDVVIHTPQVDSIVRLLKSIASEPTLFIGDKESYRSTIVFGVFRTAIPVISGRCMSELTIQVEEF